MQIKTAAALSVFAALSSFSADYYWNPAILSGSYFSYENWFNINMQTGSVPGSGDTGNFTRNTITAPETYTIYRRLLDLHQQPPLGDGGDLRHYRLPLDQAALGRFQLEQPDLPHR